MILLYLTLATVAAIVLVLVVYLIGIAYYLRRADGHLAKLVEGLRAIQSHAEPLPDHMGTINGALMTLQGNLQGIDRNLADVNAVLGANE